MATTTISISQQAYERLSKFKGDNQSFSDVILAITPEMTCGELLDTMEREVSGENFVNEKRMSEVEAGRKRRSKRL